MISINEFYGPVLQGEGPDLGRPCFFLRTQGCPVHCPGCDSAFTWDGSEKGKPMEVVDLYDRIVKEMRGYGSRCGLVLTGGEPLIHYQNPAVSNMLYGLKANGIVKWLSLETSGYAGGLGPNIASLRSFLSAFDRVSLSPKVTPCFHGKQTEDELIPFIYEIGKQVDSDKLFLKFVVKDERDFRAANDFLKLSLPFTYDEIAQSIYAMPFGQQPEEILEICRNVTPLCIKYGYQLTPRLHSLMYGAARGT
jgi:7-carboxy-7-deazaguanine synthase